MPLHVFLHLLGVVPKYIFLRVVYLFVFLFCDFPGCYQALGSILGMVKPVVDGMVKAAVDGMVKVVVDRSVNRFPDIFRFSLTFSNYSAGCFPDVFQICFPDVPRNCLGISLMVFKRIEIVAQ